jgi:hypothetical protein
MKKIKLTQGRYALVDDEDFELISAHSWYFIDRGHGYAGTNFRVGHLKYKHVLMHRLIMRTKKSQLVDHINGRGLDNRRKNLRLCNSKQNAWNRVVRKDNKSGFRGVYPCNQGYGFKASIGTGKLRKFLGCFKTAEAAARAYRRAAKNLYGDFACKRKASTVRPRHAR